MVVSIFPKQMNKARPSQLQSSTLRGFGGGWNAVDDDLSMAPKYVVTLRNMVRKPSGAQAVRQGTDWRADTKNITNSPIIDCYYFNGRIVCVTENGRVITITEAGVKQLIWSPTIAASLPGAPGGWSTGLTVVSFVPFKNTLVIHNGVDKPIRIESSFAVKYEQDLATGSNVNVPIGKYGTTAANFHCIAGVAGAPTEVHISAEGTSGTFAGDPAPNNAISIDVGAYAPEGAAEIRGLAGYRNYLIVFLQAISLQVELGVFDENGVHKPKFPDTFPTFGLIGSRCIASVEGDLIFAGLQGLTSAKRSVYATGQLDSNTISSVIEPEYVKRIGILTDDELRENTFLVYDKLGHNMMLFEPNGSVIVYTSNEKLRYKGWSEYADMEWRCGCMSLLGRVYLATGTKLFQFGNDTFGENYYADKLNDRDATWGTAKPFTAGQLVWDAVAEESYLCNVTHISGLTTFADDRVSHTNYWTLYEGNAIDFELEMPWNDGRDPMQVKKLRFVSIGSKGTAEFTLEMYVDNLYKDVDGNVIYDPALSMTFIGNDAPGFGDSSESDPFGGGRRSGDPRLWRYAAKFKKAKFRITGSVRKPLQLVNFSFLFSRGKYVRG